MTAIPNLVIAGVNKAGTTSLFTYLARHPEVSASKVKETCYFLPIRYGEPLGQFEDYLSLFDQKISSPIVMEATPGYFYGGEALAREIDSRLPFVKIVVVLRDPASRLISFFNFMKSMLTIDRSTEFRDYVVQCQSLSPAELKEKINNPYFGVEAGMYSKYLDSWKKQFGDRLKILFFEDLKNSPGALMHDLCQWLGIDASYYDNFDFSVENKTSRYRWKQLHRLSLYTNRRLEKIFRQFPRFKNIIRSLYARLNFSGKQVNVSQDDRNMAQLLYRESNLDLKRIVQEDAAVVLPQWLRDS